MPDGRRALCGVERACFGVNRSRMMHEDYQAKADEARLEAESAKLANVKERCLRSAEVWEAMARRAARTAALKKSNGG